MEDRLTALEIKTSHQEHLIDQLNDIIVKQQKTIDNIANQQNKLLEKMKSITEQLQQLPENERPPHY